MNVLILSYLGGLHWRIRPDAPDVFALEHYQGIQLLNPLIFPGLEKHQAAKRKDPAELISGYVDDAVFLETDGLAFVLSDEVANLHRPPDTSVLSQVLVKTLPLFEVAERLLVVLRYFSKQVDIPVRSEELKFWDWLQVDHLPERKLPEPSNLLRFVQRRQVETAITLPHIQASCLAEPDFQPPVYDGLCLDAIAAYHARDYRKSILYSAMAAETAAATILDEYYERYVKGAEDQRWRSIVIRIHGGRTVQKDPIWENLRKRDDFSLLLHECPLYLLGRSLMVEDEVLFRDLRQLYSTRNKIVHRGEPPPADENFLTLDAQGSSRAILAALRMLAWYGMAEDYKLNASGMVQLANQPPGVPPSDSSE